MKKRVVVSGLTALGVVCLSIVAFVFVQGQKQTFPIPPIVSRVAKLSIVSQRVEERDKATGLGVYQLKNNADKPIVAISFESDDSKGSTFHLIAHTDDQPYLGVSQEVFEVNVPHDADAHYTHITAVVYADGTASGERDSTKFLKESSDEVRNNKTGERRP